MADLNALIAQGAQFQAPPDPFAQYGKMQALQTGMNQNALAQYQLSSAKRADTLNEGLLNYMQSPGYTPEGLAQYGLPGLTALKAVNEATNAGLTGKKTQWEIQKNRQEFVEQTQRDISRNPSDANITAYKEDIQMNPLFSDTEKQQMLSAVGRVLAMPLTDRQSFLASQGAKSADLKPTITSQNLGGTVQAISTGAFGGPATVVPGSVQATTATPGELLTRASADERNRIARGQLGVAQSGLGLRALAADPFNLAGAQDKFPLGAGGGAPVPVVAGAAPATAPKGAPVAAPTLGGGKVSLNDAIKQGLKGNDLLAAMPAPIAAQVVAITDHRAAPPARNTARGDQITQLVQLVDPTYDSTSYGTKAGIEKAFASGRAGDTVRSFGTVSNHLNVLAQAATELRNGPLQISNKVGNTIASWTGEAAPAGFDAVKRIVAGEIVKAVIGSAGALGDRASVDAAINAASSPPQLAEVIQKYKALIEGQISGFRQQYKAGGGAKDFDKIFLGRTASPAAGAPPAKGWGKAVAE